MPAAASGSISTPRSANRRLKKSRTAFRELVNRRAAGTPVAYLVGHREFYSLDFEVTPDVLIPRPETELLVVALLDHVKRQAGFQSPSRQPPAPLAIADVGTGSGILAVCAAKYVPQAHVTAIDISPAALAVARRNAERHGVADRITFVESNLFAAEPAERTIRLTSSAIRRMSRRRKWSSSRRDVREHEPDIALRAGERARL